MEKTPEYIEKTCFNCFWRTTDVFHCISDDGQECWNVMGLFQNSPNVPVVCNRWQWRFVEEYHNCGKYFCAADLFP